MKFIFLGPPGAGKGTLAAIVSAKYAIPHISTGEIFRAAIKSQTPLGLKVKSIIDSGALVGDDITIELVKERLSQKDTANGFILDGFPRTIVQAKALANIIDIATVVNFDISDEDVVNRLTGRRVCKKCNQNYHVSFMPPKLEGICNACNGELFTREDDTSESIIRRLDVYRNQTAPLIEFYTEKNILTHIDANPATDAIYTEFLQLFPQK